MYHGGFAVPLPAGSLLALRGTEVSFQMSFSFVFVPELSPARHERRASGGSRGGDRLERGRGVVAAGCRDAGRVAGGPTITKSFHMIVRPAGSSEKPSATNCASRAAHG